MTVPRPVEIDPDDDGTPYALEEPIAEPVAAGPTTFVRAPSDPGSESYSPRRRPRPEEAPRPRRDRDGPAVELPNWKWLVGVPLALLAILVPVILLVPTARTIAGMVLAIIGMGALLVGYGVGAYAAFSEEILYGFLYLFIPLYTGYYLISRLDGTWPFLVAMAGGAAFITAGIWLMAGGLGAPEGSEEGDEDTVRIEVRAPDLLLDRAPRLFLVGT
jgi:hypothetical protein